MKILHLDANHPYLIEGLEALGFENDCDFESPKPQVEASIREYDGIVVRSRFPIDKSFIDAATNLKFIARVGAGMENIDTAYANQKSIALISAPEGNANALGEHALGLLLTLLNRISCADAQVRKAQWLREENRGEELDGKTIGIIGYGRMGKSFAKKLRGFDAEVLCYDIKPNLGDQNALQTGLETLQECADVLSLHVPQTPLTTHMVNQSFIESFKKPFWLLNTARGSCVKTDDLAQALKTGKIRGAALDVLEYEKTSFEALSTHHMPPSLRYLLQAENVVLTPHIGGWSHQSNEKMALVIVQKISDLFSK